MQKTIHALKALQTVVAMLVLVSIVTPSITSLSAATRLPDDPPKAENERVIPDGYEFVVVTIDEITSKTAAVIRSRSRSRTMS